MRGHGGKQKQTDFGHGLWACLLALVFAPISDRQSRNKKNTSMKPSRVSCNFKSKWEKRRILQVPSPRVQPILSCRAGRSQVVRCRCAVCLRPQPSATGKPGPEPWAHVVQKRSSPNPGVETNSVGRRCGAVQSDRVDQQNAISEQTHLGNERWHSAFPCCPLTSDQGVFGLPLAGKLRT